VGRRRAREHPHGEPPRGRERSKPVVIRRVAIALVLSILLAGCGKDSRPAGTASSNAPSTASSGALDPSAGAPGAGDPYFADLGNGGYDVQHYDLTLQVEPATNQLDATAVVTAVATQDLARFDLDLSGLDITGVMVDGAAATFTRADRELVITVAAPIAKGATFTTAVAYHGSPEPRSTPAIPIAVGWIATGDATFVLNEPEGASTWFPVNDHPSDKATYTFHITAPDSATAVANGNLVGKVPAGNGRTTWTYEERAPMASYLTQVAVGAFTTDSTQGPNGITIRNAYASELADRAPAHFARTAEMLQLFAADFGPYPFDAYGVLVVNERTQFQLETQTLSVFDSSYVDTDPSQDATAAHELAHQWFGDDVTPSTWKDVWLNEGFATYAEWLWVEHTGGSTVSDIARRVHDRIGARTVPPGDPGVEKLFEGASVYNRGALTLQALRLTVGDDAFFTILRTYVSRFAGKNVSTTDFTSVANEVAGKDLTGLFDQWLYQTDVPDLPAS
jgi:aminopeptidase N